MQRYILAADEPRSTPRSRSSRRASASDFVGILEAMDGLPVTVRLLDPPLHEFLPDVEELLVQEARGQLDDAGRRLLHAAEQWREANPMLGTRGVRLGVLRPALYRTQVRALLDAAMERKLAGGNPNVEIMIPLSVSQRRAGARRVVGEGGRRRDRVGDLRRERRRATRSGTMIETPRAALVADEIAEVAEFFSFGTNDLTQMTFGFSRDDIEGRFMPRYLELKLLPANPFETIDVEGVGALVRMAVERGPRGRDPTSSSGSAASTAATRRRSRSATRWASTTCRAPRTVCRSPGSPQRTPRSRRAARPAPRDGRGRPQRPAGHEYLDQVWPGVTSSMTIEAGRGPARPGSARTSARTGSAPAAS